MIANKRETIDQGSECGTPRTSDADFGELERVAMGIEGPASGSEGDRLGLGMRDRTRDEQGREGGDGGREGSLAVLGSF